MNILEILMDNGTISMEIASMKTPPLKQYGKALEERFKPVAERH